MASNNFVFIHGGSQGSWVWDETIAALRVQSGNNCNTLALDVPGCGSKRGRDTSELSFEAIVEELVADIAGSGMRDLVLVGHSQAGTVMSQLVASRPDTFRHLIYASCCAPLPGQTITDMMGNGLQGENPDAVGWFVNPADGSATERHQAIFCNDMQDEQTSKLLEGMNSDQWPMSSYSRRDWCYDPLETMPSSYIVFLQDRALPLIWQERFAHRLHTDQVLYIDAGHQGMMTRPHAFAELLLDAAEGES